MTDFEDPTELARCSRADCHAYRAGNTPLCAPHLREQEQGAAGYIEPELEARVRNVVTEDDRHKGEKKIYSDDGTSEWIPDPDHRAPGKLYVGPDPDTNAEPGTSWHLLRNDPPPAETEDPVKAGAKAFKRALRGKHGPAMQKMAEAFVEQLYEPLSGPL